MRGQHDAYYQNVKGKLENKHQFRDPLSTAWLESDLLRSRAPNHYSLLKTGGNFVFALSKTVSSDFPMISEGCTQQYTHGSIRPTESDRLVSIFLESEVAQGR